MATWIDPEFGTAMKTAALIAIGNVRASTPTQATIVLERVFAGTEAQGSQLDIKRADVVGVGHGGSTLPVGERFVFVVWSDAQGAYQAQTDSYWCFALADGGTSVHIPIREPATRAYIGLDDFATIVSLMRDRQATVPVGKPAGFWSRLFKKGKAQGGRAEFVADMVKRLGKTPVEANKPIQVNQQVLTLESVHHLGEPGEHIHALLPYLRSPHFQVRWSCVRALQTVAQGQPEAIQALVSMLPTANVPPVQHALAEALLALMKPGDDPAPIRRALPHYFDQSVPYDQNLMSPIKNMMPAPKKTLGAVLQKLNA